MPKNGSSADPESSAGFESFKGLTLLHYSKEPLSPVRVSRAKGRETRRGTDKTGL